MRFSRLFDAEGGYDTAPEDPTSGDLAGSTTEPDAVPLAASTMTPTAGTEPGPASNPQPPQTGNPPPPSPPVPPAVPSAVQGIGQSEATGGVRGSFGQAGTTGFTKRFGTPAAWFKGAGEKPKTGFMNELANKGRGILGRQSAGSSAGGGVTVPVVQGPSAGTESGGPNDEQWQRILAEVLKQRFGG